MSESDSDDWTGRDDAPGWDRQDPHVERVRPDPAAPPKRSLTMVGLLGDSERPGYKRLYFSAALDSYAEVRTDDILDAGSIDAAQPPFVGLEATRLTVKRTALIDYVRSAIADLIDDFDIDIQISPGGGSSSVHPLTYTMGNCGGTGGGCGGTYGCPPATEPVTQCVAMTCNTCNTCQTHCGTCNTCYQTQCPGQGTCQTCNQQTCQTCNTQCGQQTCWNTCQTCHTNCGGIDCDLNNPTAPANCIPVPGPTRVPCLTNICG